MERKRSISRYLMSIPLALFMSVSTLYAESEEKAERKTVFEQKMEEKVTLETVNTSLSEALNLLSEQTGINIVLDDHVRKYQPRLILSLKESAELQDILGSILGAENLGYKEVGENTLWITSLERLNELWGPFDEVEADANTLKKMKEERVTLDLEQGGKWTDVVKFLSAHCGLNMIMDERVTPPDTQISIKIRDESIRQALQLILMQKGLGYKITKNVIWIAKEILSPEEASIEKIRQKAMQERVTLDFVNTPFREVITFFTEGTGLNMTIDEDIFHKGGTSGVDAGAVTIKLKNRPFLDTLDILLSTRGLGYEIRPTHIWITSAENTMLYKIIDLSFLENAPEMKITKGKILEVVKKVVPQPPGSVILEE